MPLSQPAEAQNVPGPVYEVSGTVVRATGGPVADATVELVEKSASAATATARTDASGAYKFSTVAAGDYFASAHHACCLRSSVAVAVGGTELKATAKPIQLEDKQQVMSGDPVKLTGLLKSTADGKTVPGVRIEIRSGYGSAPEPECDGDVCAAMIANAQYFYVESDAAGKFEIEVNRGSAHLSASREGFDRTSGSLDMAQDRAVEVPMRPAQQSTVRLHGVLKNDAGEPVAGWINAGPDYQCGRDPCAVPVEDGGSSSDGWTHESNDPQWNSTQAGSDGSWEMRIKPGALRVTAYAEDHMEDSKAVDAQADQAVDLVLPKLPPDSATVTGKVVDRSTGQPVEGATVSAENQKWGTYASAQTGADGRFTLKTKPGYTILTARADQAYACMGGSSSSGGEPAVMAPCHPVERDSEYLPAAIAFDPAADSQSSQDFRLVPRATASSEFKGYVLDAATGKAVPDAAVTFYNEVTRDWGSATTDADGSYKIKVHPGYYSIRAWAEGHFDAVANAEIGEKESQRLDVQITPGQKRYGYWAHGGYDVSVASHGGERSAGPSAPQAESAPMPSDGQNVYEGASGGLGPYAPLAAKGSSPSAGAFLLVAGLAFALGLRRRL